MDLKFYSHNISIQDSKNEIFQVVEILKNIAIKYERNSAPLLRKLILDEIHSIGWSSSVKISFKSQISITSIKDNCGLCLQTGNMSRFYADLLKIQYLYQKGIIKAGIYILPTKRVARIMGSNMVNFERMTDELKLFSSIITVPLHIIGID